MEIPSIRTGNDFTIVWTVTDNDGNPYRLDGKSLKLTMNNARAVFDVKDFSINGNTVKWTFSGKDQSGTGTYSLTMVIADSNGRMITIDECDAFRLVPKSCLEENLTEGIPEDNGKIAVGSRINVLPVYPAPLTSDEKGNIYSGGQLLSDAIPKAIDKLGNRKRTQQVIAGRCLPIKAMVGDIYRMCEIIIKKGYFEENNPDRIDEYDLTEWKDEVSGVRRSDGGIIGYDEFVDENPVIGLATFEKYNETIGFRINLITPKLVQVLPYDKRTGIRPVDLRGVGDLKNISEQVNDYSLIACASPNIMFNMKRIVCTKPPYVGKIAIRDASDAYSLVKQAAYYTYDRFVRKRNNRTGKYHTIGRKPTRRTKEKYKENFTRPLEPRQTNLRYGRKYHVKLYRLCRGKYPYLMYEFDWLQRKQRVL